MPAAVNTVAAALKSADDTKVVLEGQIVRKIDAEHFERSVPKYTYFVLHCFRVFIGGRDAV